MDATRLQRLEDTLEIQGVLNRYASSLDTRDWGRLATCFTRDAVGDYGALGRHDGYAAIEGLIKGVLTKLDVSQHFISNHEIDLAGDTAKTRCYLQAQHVRRNTEGGDNYLVAGLYLDDWVRTPDGWKISERQLQMTWFEGNPAVVAS